MKIAIDFSVPADLEESLRVDKFLSEYKGILSRSQLKAKETRIFINDKEVKLSRKVKPGDKGTLEYLEEETDLLQGERVDFSVLYENSDLWVINKPQGLVVHPACGNKHGTLVQGLIHYCGDLKMEFENENLRPGIVHRLDKDTSGVLIAAKRVTTQEFLAKQFRNRETEKWYLAFIKGKPLKERGIIKNYIKRDERNRKRFSVCLEGGKSAETEYKLLKSWGSFSLVLLKPKTGRTHQLRVHMKDLGHPIINDPVYGRVNDSLGLMLHAYRLSITLPEPEGRRTFWAPLPGRFREFLLKNRD